VQLARELRSAGLSVELGLDAKLKRALELANKMGARFVLIAGEDEMAAGKYALKDMRTGQQETVGREELVQRIK
jgi:histidyl-tRNA synthetase